jgi:hypothetical protein
MNREPDMPDPELQERIRDLRPPLPDPAYRERNRKLFTGRIPYHTEHDRRFPAPRHRGLWTAAAGFAASLAGAAAWLFAGSGAPSWEVWEVPAGTALRVNGKTVSARNAAGMSLPPSARVHGGDLGRVRLGIPRLVSLELAPGTEVTLGSARRPFHKPDLFAQVRAGTAWGITGPAFPGRGLRVETDQARIRVAGTTFAVVSGGQKTCVCVLSGTVEVKCKITGVVLDVNPSQQLTLDASGPTRTLAPLDSDQHDLLRDVAAHTVF